MTVIQAAAEKSHYFTLPVVAEETMKMPHQHFVSHIFKHNDSLTLPVNVHEALFMFVFLLLLPTSSCDRRLDNRDVRSPKYITSMLSRHKARKGPRQEEIQMGRSGQQTAVLSCAVPPCRAPCCQRR